MGMSFEEKGAYMELLMMQFNRGHMTTHMVGQVVGQIWDKIKDKFETDDQGKFFNKRFEDEIKKRQNFVKSRYNNLDGANQYTKNRDSNTTHKDGHMTSHMENENIDINIITDKDSIEIGVQGKEKRKERSLQKEQFELFRQAYPGTKRGLDTEFNNFVNKHKDWMEVLPILYERLSYQIQARKEMDFVPEWKILQTWINKRSWEDEITKPEVTANKKRNGAPAVSAVEHARRLVESIK